MPINAESVDPFEIRDSCARDEPRRTGYPACAGYDNGGRRKILQKQKRRELSRRL